MHEKKINIIMNSVLNGNYNIRPFITNKTWKFTSDDVLFPFTKETDIADVAWYNYNVGFTFLGAMQYWIQSLGTTTITVIPGADETQSNLLNNKINVFRYYYPENHKYFGNVVNISSSLYQNTYTSQSLDPKLLWYYLDHNYYRDYRTDKNPADETNFDTNNYLSESGSILIFPRRVTGESIRKKSVSIRNKNSANDAYDYVIVDDGLGNVIDSTIDETKIIDHKYNTLYVGFNEKYREYNFVNKKLDYVLDWSNNLNNVQVVNKKSITYSPGIPITNTTQNTGVCADFNGSYLRIPNNELFNFTNDMDYSFSFWIKVPPTQSILSYKENPIFDKKTISNKDYYSSTTGIFSLKNSFGTKQFPFNISLMNTSSATPNKIKFSQSDGVKTAEVSSNTLNENTWYHIVCQKTGSVYQIWQNGTLSNSQQTNINTNVQNAYEFYVAGNGTSENYLSGSLDEIRVFSRALTSNEITNLSDNSLKYGYAYQRKEIGNIFYETGVIIISDPRPKYKTAFLGKYGNFDYENFAHGFEGSFKSATTLYEHEIVCKIDKNKFNHTQNPSSLIKYNHVNTIKSLATGSSFTPYITTIGLYNDTHDLVAIAKMATPLKKRKDIDVNVIIRFDM